MSILRQVPSETKIRRELKRILFGQRIYCPRCGSYRVKKYEQHYLCPRCRRPFSLTSVCWLKGMKLSLQTFWLLLWCWCHKVPLDQSMKLCGVSEPTCRRWFDKFRSHLPEDCSLRLQGTVQMDEAFYGGRKGSLFIAAKEKGQRKAIGKVLSRRTNLERTDVIPLLHQYIVPGSQLHTDGHLVYRGIQRWWPLKHGYTDIPNGSLA